MRLGGEARFVVEVESKMDVPAIINWAEKGGELGEPDENGKIKVITTEKNTPWFVLGGGANTIGRDTGFPGVIILMKNRGIDIIDTTEDQVMVWGEAGENWDDFVKYTVEHNFSGVECLAKIPGTVGAAPVQNIGAYGQEVSQVIDHVEAYDTEAHEFVIIGRDEMKMSYRETLFNTGDEAGRYIITGVAFVLYDGDFEPLKPPFYASLQKYLDEHNITDYSPSNLYNAVAEIRKEKLPDPNDKASSGSFFKNIYFAPDDEKMMRLAEKSGCTIYDKPNGRKMINTGALIEKAGLKGALLHGMRVSDKAALILINENAKSYADLDAARAEITDKIYDEYGFKIKQEPVEIIPNKKSLGAK